VTWALTRSPPRCISPSPSLPLTLPISLFTSLTLTLPLRLLPYSIHSLLLSPLFLAHADALLKQTLLPVTLPPSNSHSLSLPLIYTHRDCPKLIAELKCDKDCHGTDEPAYVHGRQKQIDQCDPDSSAQNYQNCTG
jgi:hypothetical protein